MSTRAESRHIKRSHAARTVRVPHGLQLVLGRVRRGVRHVPAKQEQVKRLCGVVLLNLLRRGKAQRYDSPHVRHDRDQRVRVGPGRLGRHKGARPSGVAAGRHRVAQRSPGRQAGHRCSVHRPRPPRHARLVPGPGRGEGGARGEQRGVRVGAQVAGVRQHPRDEQLPRLASEGQVQLLGVRGGGRRGKGARGNALQHVNVRLLHPALGVGAEGGSRGGQRQHAESGHGGRARAESCGGRERRDVRDRIFAKRASFVIWEGGTAFSLPANARSLSRCRGSLPLCLASAPCRACAAPGPITLYPPAQRRRLLARPCLRARCTCAAA